MIERGKFRSLTLINWNGFFARTFDLDEFVTTLSGGNGAGKSTTMAAFVTALIPDLTLLHFRNTTEAGATTGSRDKGLHGKLKPGVCYAILDVINSRRQRVLCGVRLQQVAGRDRKVDIKPFIVQGLPITITPTEIFTQVVNARQARVNTLNELKERVEQCDGALFKQFNSITDYHALMFDLGVLSKRLRSSSDRSKFYRLIEASLYGGISSAITRSLRDYLLPENGGVRKAFQDMEAALRENRMTLEAIKMTQQDRDLFKHLITEATSYVAADYMRHANERRGHLEQVLASRKSLFDDRQTLINEQCKHVAFSRELHEIQESYSDLQTDFQSASDYVSLVQTAVRQQEKITRYQSDLDELTYRLEEQTEIVEEKLAQLAECEERSQLADQEVDLIKDQLADYQQALDIQQTRSLQYQQAQDALEKAKTLCQLPNLTAQNSLEQIERLQAQEQAVTETLLEIEQKLTVANAANDKFDEAFQLAEMICGKLTRSEAWQEATQFLRKWPSVCYLAEQLPNLENELYTQEQAIDEQKRARLQLQTLEKRLGYECSVSELSSLQQDIDERIDELAMTLTEVNENQSAKKQEAQAYRQEIEKLKQIAPEWLKAQDALNTISQQCQDEFTDSQALTDKLQLLLESEREVTMQRDQIAQQKHKIEQEIARLSQPSGAEDPRLLALAERFSGVLLSEIYDDVAIDDAAYFSAVYGASRHAIVVNDLANVRAQLDELDDAPDDLYFIEGDPQSFDDSVFEIEELGQAVLVKTAERQWRYSRFPSIPLFGRAAREKHLEALSVEQEALAEKFAKLAFDVQKIQRLHQQLSQFIGRYLAIVFQPDPEEAIQQRLDKANEIDRHLSQQQQQSYQNKQQLEQLKESAGLINRLMPFLHLLQNEQLETQYEQLQQEVVEAQAAFEQMKQYGEHVKRLEELLAVLQSDPQDSQQLQAQYEQVLNQQKTLKQQLFALNDVVQRRQHFSFSEQVKIISDNGELNESLKRRLAHAEVEKNDARQQLRNLQSEVNQYSQLQASLKSAYDAKQEVLRDLIREITELGVSATPETEERALRRKDELSMRLNQQRQQTHQLEKQIMQCENEMDNLQKRLKKEERDYCQQREQVVLAKKGWCNVLRLVKDNQVEQRLHRREFAYLSGDELRSMSDKALGSLRLAVADNEHLRDILRTSEDLRYPERKILFYIAVYKHLRERIRQDIIKTDDPIVAIEQMEIELARLTEELTAREKTLAISAKSVANIINKTILREQNRIRTLNQGLQAVSFGQVKSVRLNVNVRESHAMLLAVLSEQHDIHQDLFNNNRLTFSEALAKLYQRLNPHVDFGQRAPQTIGEELLDYRNYLDLDVEVFRGSDGWLRAESGALSTGEAIGTGMSILVMVVQSWEDESRRLRGKDVSPCRLLFLDEAARLDAKSIATLFELCDRLEMQLIIAAPENISPEKGTTYKLVRKVVQNQEHVHVVGLKGFGLSTGQEAIQ